MDVRQTMKTIPMRACVNAVGGEFPTATENSHDTPFTASTWNRWIWTIHAVSAATATHVSSARQRGSSQRSMAAAMGVHQRRSFSTGGTASPDSGVNHPGGKNGGLIAPGTMRAGRGVGERLSTNAEAARRGGGRSSANYASP